MERMPQFLAISRLVGVSSLMSIRWGSMIPIQLYVWENPLHRWSKIMARVFKFISICIMTSSTRYTFLCWYVSVSSFFFWLFFKLQECFLWMADIMVFPLLSSSLRGPRWLAFHSFASHKRVVYFHHFLNPFLSFGDRPASFYTYKALLPTTFSALHFK